MAQRDNLQGFHKQDNIEGNYSSKSLKPISYKDIFLTKLVDLFADNTLLIPNIRKVPAVKPNKISVLKDDKAVYLPTASPNGAETENNNTGMRSFKFEIYSMYLFPIE